MEKERRRRTRVVSRARVVVTVNGSEVVADGGLLNISMAGIFIDSPVRLTVGTHCEVRIVIMGSGSRLVMEINGQVARTSGDGLAIEFGSDLEWWPIFAMYHQKTPA